jgi:hypothetical protein
MRTSFCFFFFLFNCIFTTGYSQLNNDIDFIVIDYKFGDNTPDKICFDYTRTFLANNGIASDSAGVKAFLKENLSRIITNDEKGLFEQLFSSDRYYEKSRAFLKWTGADINKPYYFHQGQSNFADTYRISGTHNVVFYGWDSLTVMFPLDYLYFKKYRHFPYNSHDRIVSYNFEVANYLAFTAEFQAVHSLFFEELKSNLILSFQEELDKTDFRKRTVEDESEGTYSETLYNSLKKGNQIISASKQSSYLDNYHEKRTDNIALTYYSNGFITKKATKEKFTLNDYKTALTDFTEVEFDENLLPRIVSSMRNYSDVQNFYNDDFFNFNCWGYTLNYENGYLNGISYVEGYIKEKKVYYTVEYKQQDKVQGSETYYNYDGTLNNQLNSCARAKEVFLKAQDALQKNNTDYKYIANLFMEGFAISDEITDKSIPLYNARVVYLGKNSIPFPSIFPPKGFLEECVRKGYISSW